MTMPFYIRKSVSAGPFRFNLSKGGIGVSVGVKGLRIGTGPRGHYIHAGRGGLYYRSSFPNRGKAKSTSPSLSSPPISPPLRNNAEVEMIRVSSSDVLQMEDSRFSEILADLNEKQSSVSMAKALGWGGALIWLLLIVGAGAKGFWFGVILTLLGVGVGAWLDSFKRSSVLLYDLEDDVQNTYQLVTAAFDEMQKCISKWHVDAGGAVRDIHTWKRNAGASHVVDKRPTIFDYSLPRVIKSNITPPMIKSGKENLYFFPDFLLVVDSGKVGAVAYDRLSVNWQDSNFIEEGTVPSDTQVLGHVWKHPNKSGGPDRRFSNNYQIPLCRYESIHLSSDNGLNELLQVSRSGVTAPFSAALASLSKVHGNSPRSANLPQLG
ncbi:MAG: DUF4236 domain-containing protein [Alphaproteobacteria bacterium]|nr:DUF4236 domain-containing protein [Alphaproteobacteria bacterium]MBU0793264.1 DUF4236 domain-containing protein [Alphaproteobacteria bacterium]MBU0875608.1 DUF4236 domain-containing protein [Alphaproteobacteria bacterium]MBU1771313.1 DUF4236 domain-containing protein [Alphaproteobacteria bacterium]